MCFQVSGLRVGWRWGYVGQRGSCHPHPQNFPNFKKCLGKMATTRKMSIVDEMFAPRQYPQATGLLFSLNIIDEERLEKSNYENEINKIRKTKTIWGNTNKDYCVAFSFLSLYSNYCSQYLLNSSLKSGHFEKTLEF